MLSGLTTHTRTQIVVIVKAVEENWEVIDTSVALMVVMVSSVCVLTSKLMKLYASYIYIYTAFTHQSYLNKVVLRCSMDCLQEA